MNEYRLEDDVLSVVKQVVKEITTDKTRDKTSSDTINVLQNSSIQKSLLAKIVVEPTKLSHFGDFSTNAALLFCKYMDPQEFLSQILNLEYVKEVSLAGPGFINIRVTDKFWQKQLSTILEQKNDFGKLNIGKRKKVNIEYVSTNPTGPLHIGHARGAVFGDVLANLLKSVNYDVTKEYYVNDAGAQIQILTTSLHKRYLECLGHDVGEIEGYKGKYLKDVANDIYQKYGEKFVDIEIDNNLFDELKNLAVTYMMNLIRKDLKDIGIEHDVFTSEQALITQGKVDEMFKILNNIGLIYEGVLEPPKGKEEQTWSSRTQILFRSSAYGDDSDRALKKEDGSWAYLAPDIAYHLDKYKRSDSEKGMLINVWGADHKGYIARVNAALSALSDNKAQLHVAICQLVRFVEDGKPAKMSKRSGNFVLLRDLIEKIGSDAIRFMLASRKNDTQFDFDLVKALEQSKDNPVFYVQYAHARCCSVLRKATDTFSNLESNDIDESTFSFYGEHEFNVVRCLANYPRTIKLASLHKEPHRITNYLYDLAAEIHGLWSLARNDKNARILDPNNLEHTRAKVLLVQACIYVLQNALGIIEVDAPQKM